MRTLMLVIMLGVVGCEAGTVVGSVGTPSEDSCEGPTLCREDADCYVDMCMGSTCVDGVCHHEQRPDGMQCIQWSVKEQRHIAGYCSLCRCEESPPGT